jgi:serine/threonine protein kinase
MQLRELDFHARGSNHPSIITFHRSFSDSKYMYFFFDTCISDDLSTSVTERAVYFHDDRLKKAFLQPIDTVEFCHPKGMYHGSLKPENILSSADVSRLYLTDFGLASENILSSTFGIGSTLYTSAGEFYLPPAPGFRG